MLNGDILFLSGCVFLLTALAAGLRKIMWHSVRNSRQLSSVSHVATLAPAELAYLLRDGDMSHTLIVLSVDLIQRTIKAPADVSATLRPYEKQVWLSVKDFLRQLAEQKAGHLVPVSNIKNPVQWAVRISALKQFVGNTLGTFVKEVVKDPRHLRKYFSIGGVARLAVQLYTSSVRGAVERELREELLHSGMLVTDARRHKFAAIAATLIPITVAVVLVANHFLSAVNWSTLAAYLAMGVVNAIILALIYSLPGFVPTYEEFRKVSAELQRSGARLAAVRVILKAGKFVLIALLVVAAFLLFGINYAVASMVLHVINPLPILAFTGLGFILVAFAVDWHSLTLHEQATLAAEHQMKIAQSALSQTSPLQSFSNMFSDEDYDPTFSQLVAFYGVETLWLLS